MVAAHQELKPYSAPRADPAADLRPSAGQAASGVLPGRRADVERLRHHINVEVSSREELRVDHELPEWSHWQ